MASTFFTAAVAAAATAGGGWGLALVTAGFGAAAVVLAFCWPTTTGSEDGIGFPSLVCSFSTWIDRSGYISFSQIDHALV